MTENSKPLGPWQSGWDAWSEGHDRCMSFSPDHFQTTLLIQIIEVREQLALGDDEHAAKEMNDIISVTLNWMRWLGFEPQDIARIAEERGTLRYKGQVHEIMDKYCARLGI